MWKPGFDPARLPAAFPLESARAIYLPTSMDPSHFSSSGVLRARRIMTMTGGPDAQAVWWEAGRIQSVGTVSEVERAASVAVPRYELPEALVTPGFVDGHTHFAMWALNRGRVELAGARTRDEVVDRIASAQPTNGWIIGHGWDSNGWSLQPDRMALDGVQKGPVYLGSLDVHAAWVNTAALKAAGISRDTPDPFGGRIVRDGNGDLTGVLLERAVELVHPCVPTSGEGTLDAALLEAQAEAHTLGITGIHVMEGLDTLAAFQRLDAAGRLQLRVLFHPPVASLPQLVSEGIRSGQCVSGRVTIGGVKMFLDGSLGSRTAWMLQPYEGTRDRGMPVTNEGDARTAMKAAAAAGLSTTVHAIGDAAVRRALDLTSSLPRLAIPHRIEHFQCVHRSDLQRAASSGIVVSMQPAHLLTDIPLVDRHWGDRGKGAYAFRSLVRRGASLVFGSDVPVASIDPREGIYAALARKASDGSPVEGWHTNEKLRFVDAVRAYTAAPAHAAGSEGRSGKVAPGFDADLVAWAVDPAAEEGNGEAFRRGRAVMTVVGGVPVMQV